MGGKIKAKKKTIQTSNLLEIPISPKPFLRWAGGKRRLIPLILEFFPLTFSGLDNHFYEPFVGGGALSLHLGNRDLKNHVPGKNLVLNDINPDLITAYTVVRDKVEELITSLSIVSKDVSKSQFEKIRAWDPKTDLEKAVRFIYLNKTCFNGLWRVNSRGEFNVPWGKLRNPRIFEENDLRVVSQRLQGSTIRNSSFTSCVEDSRKGDLVYFDPPYIPLSNSSSFSKYAKDDFGIMDHFALAGVIEGLTSRGVKVILSNSDTAITKEVYGNQLDLRQISVQRNISASSKSRISVKEIIGVNFSVSKSSQISKLKIV
jgi:DNA adenine methylase